MIHNIKTYQVSHIDKKRLYCTLLHFSYITQYKNTLTFISEKLFAIFCEC